MKPLSNPDLKATGGAAAPAVAIESNNIVFPHLIGHFPVKNPFQEVAKIIYSTTFTLNGNQVVNEPTMPDPADAKTFHRALFMNRVPAEKIKAPYPAADRPRLRTRLATAMVLIVVAGKHIIIADFTDPVHPCIFDPNYGWIEPRQGFCFLDFEQMMHSIWEVYTNNNQTNKNQGLQHIGLAEGEDDTFLFMLAFMLAFQLYVQLG